jgi:glycogen(starch) synthase
VFSQQPLRALLSALVFLKRPWVIAYQTWITQPDGSTGWSERVKRLLLRAVHSVWISRAIAGALPLTSRITSNCYDNSTFDHASIDASARERALIFVGRLVSDKGAEIVLQALALLGRAVNGVQTHILKIGKIELFYDLNPVS